MESTARIKTAKGNKIRVSDIGDFRIVDRKSMMDMILNFNQLLIEYETEEDFREVFPQSNNDQHFLLAQKKDDELKQRQRDLEMALDATPNIHYTSLVHESPHMAIVKKLKSSMQYERYYILAAGSESECKEYKKKAEEKQNRFEMKGEGSMNESPLPKLTESREEARRKIEERITKGRELLDAPFTTWEDIFTGFDGWSEYNEVLLDKLFGGESVRNHYYSRFSRRDERTIDEDVDDGEGLRRMTKSIDSLEGICKRLELYDEYLEPTNTTQHSFGKDVFIIHGRDDGAKDSVVRVVGEDLELKPIILQEEPDKGNTVIEKLERCSSNVGYAIALVTPDDIGTLKDIEDDELNPRARQNVVFELGYFMGKLGRDRVCLLLKDQVELPSDIGGIVYIYMDPNDGWKDRLRRNIRAVIKEIPDE